MRLTHLVIREINHQKLNFWLGVFAATLAVGCFVCVLMLFQKYDMLTKQILIEKEAKTTQNMAQLEDDYRKIMKNLGHNVLILPKTQKLSDFYDKGYADSYMPEEYVSKLSKSKIVTIRHLLPILEQKINWPEQNNMQIFIVGIRGEIPIMHPSAKNPIIQAVPTGKVVIGYEIAQDLGLVSGDKIRILGENFVINDIHKPRGNKDDITVWVDLSTAQRLFQKPNLINGIWALECQCAWADIGKVREEIEKILPDIRVIEKTPEAAARAQVRYLAKQATGDITSAEKQTQSMLNDKKRMLILWLLPTVIFVAMIWICFLAFNNIRHRQNEIGLLKAIGLRSWQVLAVFLGRAFILGLIAGAIGYLAGFTVSLIAFKNIELISKVNGLLIFLGCIIVTAVLSCLTCIPPALIAACQDPANILRRQ